MLLSLFTSCLCTLSHVIVYVIIERTCSVKNGKFDMSYLFVHTLQLKFKGQSSRLLTKA